jgi:hypothetical protein
MGAKSPFGALVTAAVAAVFLSLTAIAAASTRPEQKKPEPSKSSPSKENKIRRCPKRTITSYLEDDLLQCWFDGPSGRWRTLKHDFHYTNLVVEVEAASLDAAGEIARRWVDVHKMEYAEILVYVQAEKTPATSPIRRVRWMKDKGFETLEYVGALQR